MISNYYVISYSSEGKCNLLDNNVKELKRIIVIDCCSRLISTMILKKISNDMLTDDSDLEIIHDSIDNNVIVGLINKNSSVGIFSKSLIENCDTYNEVKEQINLNCCYSFESDKIKELNNNVKNKYDEAICYFKEAKIIHDEWEQVYIKNIDFCDADKLIDLTIQEILGDINFDKESTSHERFFGAISANGATNYVDEIIEKYEHRYFIKGRPGTSKSTLLKRLTKDAKERGIDFNIYYCASDTSSLDMLVLPELSTCIFDSTAPHEFFPTREHDHVIDMYSVLLEENFDEKNQSLLNDIKARYNESVAKVISIFKEIYGLYDSLETEYISTIDFDMLSKLYQNILNIIK